MEHIERKPMDRFDMVVHLVGLPFRALNSAAKVTARSATAAPKAPPAPSVLPTAPSIVNETPPAPMAALRVADRVHSQVYGSMTVYFYHYIAEKIIKAKCRRDGREKEVIYTPEVAAKASTPFSIEGAVRFIRDVGFTDGQAASALLQIQHPSKELNEKPKTSRKPLNLPKSLGEVTTVVPVEARRSQRPFEGSVVSFGSTQRNGLDGKPPYTTFYLKLYNMQTGEREFIGEQLAELVEQHKLEKEQMIRLHPLGRRPFEVEENGVVQKRHRNEYSIDIL